MNLLQRLVQAVYDSFGKRLFPRGRKTRYLLKYASRLPLPEQTVKALLQFVNLILQTHTRFLSLLAIDSSYPRILLFQYIRRESLVKERNSDLFLEL
jgi:hypothetical protein